MTDAAGAPNWRQTLEQCLTDLTRLRNQTSPNIAFKKWRLAAIGAIQALWPEDRAKASRFLRIPFLPSSAKADRMEVRRVYDRGCGEASDYLKKLVAELSGRPADPATAVEPAPAPIALAAPEIETLPDLSWFDVDPAAPDGVPGHRAGLGGGGAATGSEEHQFLPGSPVFAVRSAPGEPRSETVRPALSPATLALMSMAVEIETLGVPESDRSRVREALLELARTLDTGQLSWQRLHATVSVAMEYPAVGRRVLPLVVPFVDRAA